MLSLSVKFDDAGAARMLVSLRGDLETRAELHRAMAVAVEESVRAHLIARSAAKSPRTGFYGKASRSVESHATADAGTVTIPHRGMALRYYGGRVVPVEMKNLALPTANVPIRGDERMRPGEMKNLAYIPCRRHGVNATTGYLVEGVEKTMTKGKHKGKVRLVPKPDGKLMYILRGFTDHAADPTELPPHPAMLAAAASAGGDYLAAAAREGGAA